MSKDGSYTSEKEIIELYMKLFLKGKIIKNGAAFKRMEQLKQKYELKKNKKINSIFD